MNLIIIFIVSKTFMAITYNNQIHFILISNLSILPYIVFLGTVLPVINIYYIEAEPSELKQI